MRTPCLYANPARCHDGSQRVMTGHEPATLETLAGEHLSDRHFMGAMRRRHRRGLRCPPLAHLPITREKRPNIDRWHATLQARPATAKALVTPVT
jgi:hypothetical protein